MCPEGLLSRTGLADVFEQAVFPTVLSLPSLTPEAESAALLGAAYPALFDMAGIEGPNLAAAGHGNDDVTDDSVAPDTQNSQNRGFSEAQRKLLDKIFREGIMTGYHHAKGHIRLVDFFCNTLRCLVDCIGILSVKYLKVCFLSTVLRLSPQCNGHLYTPIRFDKKYYHPWPILFPCRQHEASLRDENI